MGQTDMRGGGWGGGRECEDDDESAVFLFFLLFARDPIFSQMGDDTGGGTLYIFLSLLSRS